MRDKREDSPPSQGTRPKRGKSVEIPVPTRKEVFDLMEGVTGKRPSDGSPKK